MPRIGLPMRLSAGRFALLKTLESNTKARGNLQGHSRIELESQLRLAVARRI